MQFRKRCALNADKIQDSALRCGRQAGDWATRRCVARHRGPDSRWRLGTIVLHVRLDEMAGGEGRAQRQLASEYRGGDYAGELAGVGTRRRGVGAAHTKYVEHCGLRREEGAAAYGANFD